MSNFLYDRFYISYYILSCRVWLLSLGSPFSCRKEAIFNKEEDLEVEWTPETAGKENVNVQKKWIP